MKVIFASQKINSNSKPDLNNDDSHIRIGLECEVLYQVYGIIVIQGEVNFYICDRLHQDFPVFYPSSLFEVIDPRLSRIWIYGYIKGEKVFPAFLFKEAFADAYFFDKLTDGEKHEFDLFKKYKELMDLEYSDQNVTQMAQMGDDKRLICPDCIDAWESSSAIDALVRCPKCLKVFNNPRFKLNVI